MGPASCPPIFQPERPMSRHFLNIGLICISAFSFAPALRADQVVLVAGGTKPVNNLPATESKLDGPFGVDIDRTGTMFIVEISGQRVLKVDSSGTLTRIAGTGAKGNGGDGSPALEAQFNGMHSLAVAPSGDIYLADTWNNRVRKIDARTGLITAVAGTGEMGYSGDGGPATEAKCSGVYCVALDRAGEKLYLADRENRRVRMVELKSGVISTVAGNGEKGVPKDGAAGKDSPLVDPRAVAVDSQGTLYIAERSGFALRAVDRAGKIRTVAGTGEQGPAGDGGEAKAARFGGIKHLYCDAQDNVIIADTDCHTVRKFLPRENKIIRVAGAGEKGSAGVGGPAKDVQLNQPHGVCVDAHGVIYIVDSKNHRILKIVD